MALKYSYKKNLLQFILSVKSKFLYPGLVFLCIFQAIKINVKRLRTWTPNWFEQTLSFAGIRMVN